MLVTPQQVRDSFNQIKIVIITGVETQIWGIYSYDEASQTVRLINHNGLDQLKELLDLKGNEVTREEELKILDNPNNFSVFVIDQLVAIKGLI